MIRNVTNYVPIMTHAHTHAHTSIDIRIVGSFKEQALVLGLPEYLRRFKHHILYFLCLIFNYFYLIELNVSIIIANS